MCIFELRSRPPAGTGLQVERQPTGALLGERRDKEMAQYLPIPYVIGLMHPMWSIYCIADFEGFFTAM
jgi:hypothetical protein